MDYLMGVRDESTRWVRGLQRGLVAVPGLAGRLAAY